MERVALDAAAFGGRMHEAEIEMGVVTHQNGALALVRLDLATDLAE